MYALLIRPVLFLFPPEKAHHLALILLRTQIKLLKAFGLINFFYPKKESKNISAFGLRFPNMVGLAAGFDKDAKYLNIMQFLGFGFIEVGTVTPLAQVGNPQPRLFRLPKDKSIINRMGFNNGGVEMMVDQLKKFKNERDIIIGGNIGKNKNTPNDEAINDYLICFEAIFEYVDYFVVNVSSPNTPGLRELQNKEPLNDLLATLMAANNKKPNPKPILLKIAPDMSEDLLKDVIEVVKLNKIDGIILNNTTTDRSNLETDDSIIDRIGAGGLSGKAIRSKAVNFQKSFVELSENQIPFISVGGIMSKKDGEESAGLGAKLLQVYTGFIYEGPRLIRDLAEIND